MEAVSEASEFIFKHRHFRRYFLASCTSTLGTWTTRFLFGWLAWDLTHSAMWVGIVSALMLLPAFLLAPFFGVMADRMNAQRGMSLTLLGQVGLTVVAALATGQGWFSLSWLLGLALACGSVASAYTPLRLSLVPQLVPRSLLSKAIAISAVVFNVSRIIGPAFAGWLITLTTVTAAFVVSALLYASAVLLILRITELHPVKRADKGSVLGQLRSGLQFTLAHPVIRLVLMLTTINALLGRTLLEMLPALSGKLLDGSAATLAQLTASAGVGAIVSSLLMGRLRGNERKMERMMFISLISSGLVVMLLRWLRHPWLVMGIVCYLSLAVTMAGICGQALIQLVVSDDFRGRVMSLWTVFAMGVPALGSFVLGVLAERFGLVTSLMGFAIVVLVLTLMLQLQPRVASSGRE